MSACWYLYNKAKNIEEISQKFGISPITSVILCNREITNDEDIRKILSKDICDINDAKLLPDVDKASKIINEYVNSKKKIRIVGDYDIDGVCSTYILNDAIKRLGGDVSYDIPDRVADGYGINQTIIDKAIDDKIDLIITCDNGIAASEQIAYAKANNIEVIVTDHHDILESPSAAGAVVNPKRDDVEIKYPFYNICGAVVAWKLMIRYYELYQNDKDFVINNYLEFAMIATVGDIMPLTNENHIITKLGLKKVVNTKNKGLRKLLDISGIDIKSKGISTYHIGFIIGPLINAAGRMDKAILALRLFITDDEKEINDIANTLKSLNDERKKMTEDGFKIAVDRIDKEYYKDKVIVVLIEGIGEQVAGIVAGRIKEKYCKPTIVITDTMDSGEVKASCRSIESYDIFEALSRHKEMFLKFGGHKLAAGFSMLKKDVDELRYILNSECELEEKDFIQKMHIDMELPFYNVDLNMVRELEQLEPYGQNFQRPVFATKKVYCSIKNIYGSENNIVQLILNKDNKVSKAVAFTDSNLLRDRLNQDNIIDILYSPKINEFRGEKYIDINISDYR